MLICYDQTVFVEVDSMQLSVEADNTHSSQPESADTSHFSASDAGPSRVCRSRHISASVCYVTFLGTELSVGVAIHLLS